VRPLRLYTGRTVAAFSASSPPRRAGAPLQARWHSYRPPWPPQPLRSSTAYGSAGLRQRPLGAAQLSLVGYAGAGPRLLALLDQPQFAIGIGGLIGFEARYSGLGLFLDLDASVLFLGAGATGLTFAPVPIPKVTAGVNYHF
jgi:hypothetical protein